MRAVRLIAASSIPVALPATGPAAGEAPKPEAAKAEGQRPEAFDEAARGATAIRGLFTFHRNGDLPLDPAPAAVQKAPLGLLEDHLPAPGAFRFPLRPSNKLNDEGFRSFTNFGATAARFDARVHNMAPEIRESLMDPALHPAAPKRILEAELTSPENGFRPGELFSGIQGPLGEFRATGATLNINSLRLGSQREHLRRMTGMAPRDAAVPEDSRPTARQSVPALRGRIHRVAAPVLKESPATRAHSREPVARVAKGSKANRERMAL